ncbi:MAG: hypothetical protein VYE73_14440 [Acidobacteriota bacterium]|nr:hypothetical protein [Acidobacteriota bacterium]
MSPADWKVAQGWRDEGMPVDFVIEALSEVFERRREREAEERVSSLRYCAAPVKAAWRHQQELLGPARRQPAPALDVGQRLVALADSLPASWGPSASIAGWVRQLEGTASEVEVRLEQLDDEMLAMAWAGIDQEGRDELDDSLREGVGRLSSRLAGVELDHARRLLRARRVRRKLGLPVLSLFAGPPIEEPD